MLLPPRSTLFPYTTLFRSWEGVDLGVLSALFKVVPDEEIARFVLETPTGVYSRRLWFLYEWLTGRRLKIDDLGKVRAVPVIDSELQFGLSEGIAIARQKVTNNLPGTPQFCPLVRRTPELERNRQSGFDERAREISGRTHPGILARAAAFLLLSDSRSEEHTSELQSPMYLVCRLLLEKK